MIALRSLLFYPLASWISAVVLGRKRTVNDEPIHRSSFTVCFREPIHRSSFTVCFREQELNKKWFTSRKHTVRELPLKIVFSI